MNSTVQPPTETLGSAVPHAATPSGGKPQEPGSPRSFAGLPLGTYTIASVSVFDMLAFYGMQTLLVYFIYFSATDGGLGFDMGLAFAVVSAFSAASFLATIFGSWLCDRVLGPDLTLRCAAAAAVLGYLALALLPGAYGIAIGLVVLCLAAASMWVAEGALTSHTLERVPKKREAGFTVYYLGSAGGVFVGITLGGFLHEAFGFRIGFLASAILLSIGFGIYLLVRSRTIPAVAPIAQQDRAHGWSLALPLILVAIAVTVLVTMVITGFNPATAIAGGALVYAVFAFARLLGSHQITSLQKRRVLSYLPFFLATLVFAMLYQQLYTTIAVHSEASTDRVLWGFEVPPSVVLGFAPLCTIIVAPFLAMLWGKLGERQPALSLKFAAAFLCCGAALVALAISAASGSSTPLLLLAAIVFVFGAADMVLSPAGISMATDVAPPGHQGRVLALHYVGASIGTAAAGVFAERFEPGVGEAPYFTAFGVLGFLVAAGMIAVRIFNRKRAIR